MGGNHRNSHHIWTIKFVARFESLTSSFKFESVYFPVSLPFPAYSYSTAAASRGHAPVACSIRVTTGVS